MTAFGFCSNSVLFSSIDRALNRSGFIFLEGSGRTQEPIENTEKETNRLEAADIEDEDADNVSGAELCDEAPRLRLVEQSQNDNDDEIDNSQRGEEVEEYWNPEVPRTNT